MFTQNYYEAHKYARAILSLSRQVMVETFPNLNNSNLNNIILACDDYKKNQYMFESYGIPCLDPFNVTN